MTASTCSVAFAQSSLLLNPDDSRIFNHIAVRQPLLPLPVRGKAGPPPLLRSVLTLARMPGAGSRAETTGSKKASTQEGRGEATAESAVASLAERSHALRPPVPLLAPERMARQEAPASARPALSHERGPREQRPLRFWASSRSSSTLTAAVLPRLAASGPRSARWQRTSWCATSTSLSPTRGTAKLDPCGSMLR